MFSVLGPGARTTVPSRLIGFRFPFSGFPFSAPVPGPPFSDGSSAFGSRSRPRCPDHRSRTAHRLSVSVLGLGTRTTVLRRLIGFRVPFSASVPDHRPDPAHQLPPPRAGVARGSLKH